MSEYINNHTQRKEALKRMIRQLHEGKTVAEVKGEFAALLKEVSASEIAEIEQALIAEGLPEMEIKRLCDVHTAVFAEGLETAPQPTAPPGHPLDLFRAENEAAAKTLDALEAAIQAAQWEPARGLLRELRGVLETHYRRKENILFPYLEKHGFTGPSSVMWAIHDDVRAGWKKLDALLADTPDPAAVAETFGPLAEAIRQMFYKETNILYPAALQMLTPEEWEAIRAQEKEVGEYARLEAAAPQAERLIPLQVGALAPKQIALILTHLPVDVTFVDENDEVRFFSATKERIFQRTPAIIGRKVQKCHPPASVHRVQRILDDFREGKRDVAEFWIQMQDRFIHIRYFPVRDESGKYMGTLEVSQDVTGIRALEGERRLLDDGD
jgi:DUF438 domain-containing protein